MAKLIITDKMQEILSIDGGHGGPISMSLLWLLWYHQGKISKENAMSNGKGSVEGVLFKLIKAEYDKNKSAAERKRVLRDSRETVSGQSDQEKETPKEKELPPLASPSLEKENTKEKELFVQTEFGRWWKEFPKKEAKKKAFEIFRGKCKKLDETGIKDLVDLMLAETKAQGIEKGWNYKTRRQYIPMPTTWLNQERYMDGFSKREIIPFAHPDNRGAAKRPANYLPSEGGTDGAF